MRLAASSLKRGVRNWGGGGSTGLSLTLTEAGSVRGERLRLHSPRERGFLFSFGTPGRCPGLQIGRPYGALATRHEPDASKIQTTVDRVRGECDRHANGSNENGRLLTSAATAVGDRGRASAWFHSISAFSDIFEGERIWSAMIRRFFAPRKSKEGIGGRLELGSKFLFSGFMANFTIPSGLLV